jgi:cytochrome P450
MSTSKATSPPSTPGSACPVSHLGQRFDAFDGDPYAFYAQARQEEPVFYSPQIGYWVITRYQDVQRILLDTDTFSATNAIELLKPLCPAALSKLGEYGFVPKPTLVAQDPPIHTRYRALLRKPFTTEGVAALAPRIRKLVTTSIDSFVKRGKADLVSDFMFEAPALVLFQMMGVPQTELPIVRKFAKRHAVFSFGHPTAEEQVELAKDIGEYWEYAKRHIDRLLADPQDDVMSHFIKGLRDPKNADLWDIDYLYTIMMGLLFAGHETTTNASAGAFRALLEHRDQWVSLCQDPSLIPNTVEESLRYYSSVPQWRRITTKPVSIAGADIPAGARLLIALGSANHDHEKFTDGDTFDIHRPNANEHLAFGWGRHLCLGEGLARLEMRIALEELARRLPHIYLVEGQAWEFSPNISHRGPEHVRVMWDPTQNPIPEDRP